MNLYRRAAILKNQSGGGLSTDRRIVGLPLIRGSKGQWSVVGYLRGWRFRCVIRWRLVTIISLLRAGLGSAACVVLAVVLGKPSVRHGEAIAKRVQPGVARVDVRGMGTISHAVPVIIRPVGRARARRRPVLPFTNRRRWEAHPRAQSHRARRETGTARGTWERWGGANMNFSAKVCGGGRSA